MERIIRIEGKRREVPEIAYLSLFFVISWTIWTFFCTFSGNISILPNTFNRTPC